MVVEAHEFDSAQKHCKYLDVPWRETRDLILKSNIPLLEPSASNLKDYGFKSAREYSIFNYVGML